MAELWEIHQTTTPKEKQTGTRRIGLRMKNISTDGRKILRGRRKGNRET
jgi:ribosomal protein L34